MTIDWTIPILWYNKPARVQGPQLPNGDWVIYILDTGSVLVCRNDGIWANQRAVTNVLERVERWANVYGDNRGHSTREAADLNARPDRTALVRYTFENDKLVDVAIVPLED